MSIPGISHTVSSEVKNSLTQLQSELHNWGENDRICGRLNETVLAGGKRLRPLLTLVMGDLFGVPHKDLMTFARVVEMVHAATLAHDDVIDNASVRRGEPSLNSITSNKKAVLAGDYLLAHSLAAVAEKGNSELVSLLAEIIADLAEGEWIQIENSQSSSLTREDIHKVCLKKTGSVLRWCSTVAPILKSQSDDIVKQARTFGEDLGIAFQMTDDLLDFSRNDGAEFADIENNVVNTVIFEYYALLNGSDTLNMSEKPKLSLSDPKLREAIDIVRDLATQKLDQCRKTLVEFLNIDIPDANPKKRNEAFITLSCLIEFLTQRG